MLRKTEKGFDFNGRNPLEIQAGYWNTRPIPEVLDSALARVNHVTLLHFHTANSEKFSFSCCCGCNDLSQNAW